MCYTKLSYRQGGDVDMIKVINYENETRLLEVGFINGVIFRYFDVPSQIATSFISSNTNVEFFNKNIRSRFINLKVS